MYVNRMRLLNVKPLHRDIPAGGGALPEPAHRRLLLQGANGSGKTTILQVVLTLWRFLGDWLDSPGGPPSEKHLRHFLAEADLAAMEIVGLTSSQPLWLGVGKSREWQPLKEMHRGALFAGLVHGKDDWKIELPPVDLLSHRLRSLAGAESFPNVVYFRPDGRSIRRPKEPRAKILDTTRFNWAAVYHPTISLDSVLLTLKVHSPARFENCLRLVNMALVHRQKRITGFGATGRLIVEGTTESGVTYQHPIEELSSGEQQILLLVGFVAASLRPGGIVLLDEPDLHIHIGMVDQLLETMERVVQERKGQLIVASHSVRVWEWFSRPEEQIDLNPWRGNNT